MVPTEEATENDPNQDDAADEQSAQANMGPMNGNFMSFGGGDMNQMQMMMAMQNGMNPAAFGSFPMMGKFFFLTPAALYTNQLANIPFRHGHGHEPDDDAEHVYERWLWRARHERHEHEHGYEWFQRWWQ